MSVFDDIKRDVRHQFYQLLAETVARIRAVEPQERIKEHLGFQMCNWREIVVTTMHIRSDKGFFHSSDLLDAATEAAESAIMRGGDKEGAIDAIEREFASREFRLDGSDSPCDEIIAPNFAGWCGKIAA